MYTVLRIVCVFAALMAMTCGCTGDVNGLPLQEPDLIPAALPYVEAVHLPAQIHAGQQLTITLDLSCAQNPLALLSSTHSIPDFDHWTGTGSVTLVPYRDLSQARADLPALSNIAYDCGPLAQGAWTLHYYSAPTREQGGLAFEFDRSTDQAMNIDISSYQRTMAFTVLP